MKFGYLAATAFAVLAISAGAARAATFTELATTGALQTTDFTDNLTLAGFNTSLGTLTGVSVTLSDAGAFGGNLQNGASSVESFKITEDVNFTTNSSSTLLASLTTDLVATQTYTNLASAASAAFGPYSPTSSVSGTATAAQIGEFLAGNVSLSLATLTGTTVLGGGGNIINKITTQADATVTITYTYSPSAPPPVPEPASLAVLGMGLLGLGFVRAKSSKSL